MTTLEGENVELLRNVESLERQLNHIKGDRDKQAMAHRKAVSQQVRDNGLLRSRLAKANQDNDELKAKNAELERDVLLAQKHSKEVYEELHRSHLSTQKRHQEISERETAEKARVSKYGVQETMQLRSVIDDLRVELHNEKVSRSREKVNLESAVLDANTTIRFADKQIEDNHSILTFEQKRNEDCEQKIKKLLEETEERAITIIDLQNNAKDMALEKSTTVNQLQVRHELQEKQIRDLTTSIQHLQERYDSAMENMNTMRLNMLEIQKDMSLKILTVGSDNVQLSSDLKRLNARMQNMIHENDQLWSSSKQQDALLGASNGIICDLTDKIMAVQPSLVAESQSTVPVFSSTFPAFSSVTQSPKRSVSPLSPKQSPDRTRSRSPKRNTFSTNASANQSPSRSVSYKHTAADRLGKDSSSTHNSPYLTRYEKFLASQYHNGKAPSLSSPASEEEGSFSEEVGGDGPFSTEETSRRALSVLANKFQLMEASWARRLENETNDLQLLIEKGNLELEQEKVSTKQLRQNFIGDIELTSQQIIDMENRLNSLSNENIELRRQLLHVPKSEENVLVLGNHAEEMDALLHSLCFAPHDSSQSSGKTDDFADFSTFLASMEHSDDASDITGVVTAKSPGQLSPSRRAPGRGTPVQSPQRSPGLVSPISGTTQLANCMNAPVAFAKLSERIRLFIMQQKSVPESQLSVQVPVDAFLTFLTNCRDAFERIERLLRYVYWQYYVPYERLNKVHNNQLNASKMEQDGVIIEKEKLNSQIMSLTSELHHSKHQVDQLRNCVESLPNIISSPPTNGNNLPLPLSTSRSLTLGLGGGVRATSVRDEESNQNRRLVDKLQMSEIRCQALTDQLASMPASLMVAQAEKRVMDSKLQQYQAISEARIRAHQTDAQRRNNEYQSHITVQLQEINGLRDKLKQSDRTVHELNLHLTAIQSAEKVEKKHGAPVDLPIAPWNMTNPQSYEQRSTNPVVQPPHVSTVPVPHTPPPMSSNLNYSTVSNSLSLLHHPSSSNGEPLAIPGTVSKFDGPPYRPSTSDPFAHTVPVYEKSQSLHQGGSSFQSSSAPVSRSYPNHAFPTSVVQHPRQPQDTSPSHLHHNGKPRGAVALPNHSFDSGELTMLETLDASVVNSFPIAMR